MLSSDFAETSEGNSIAIDELPIPQPRPFTLEVDELLPFYSPTPTEATATEEDDPEPSIKSEIGTPEKPRFLSLKGNAQEWKSLQRLVQSDSWSSI